MDKYKSCKDCGAVFPLTEEHFYKNGNTFDCRCKKCRCAFQKEYRERNRKKIKERDKEYYRNHSEEIKAYREAHREEARIYRREHYDPACDKEYRERNAERIKEKKRERYQANKERYLGYARKWREENPEKFKEHVKKYRENHPEVERIRKQRRKARKKMLEASFSKADWEQARNEFSYKCAYCGSTGKLTQDHFIALKNGGGYTRKNIIPACLRCNCSKNDKPFNEWYQTQPFYSEEREKHILHYIECMEG